MATPYSRKSLAEHIGSGQDTASAAKAFNKSIHFIEHEQQTREYQYYLDTYLDSLTRERREVKRTAERGLTLPLPRPGGDGTTRRTGGMQPFSVDGMRGRTYGPMIPFNRYDKLKMLPFSGDPMDDKPSGDPMLGRYPKKRESGEDILDMFDGVRELVATYMLELLGNRIPQPTGPELITILNGLPVGSRINFNWLDGRPSIPLNTASWHGAWRSETAYVSGSIVIDNNSVFIYIVDIPATNTTRPADDTAARVEHLDVGSPLDIVDAAQSGLNFVFNRRNGDRVILTFGPDEVYSVLNAMTDTQKSIILLNMADALNDARINAFRDAINAQIKGNYAQADHTHAASGITEAQARALFSLLGHNHDNRYYTESQSNSRFAPRSHSHSYAPNNGAGIIALIDVVLGTGWKSSGTTVTTQLVYNLFNAMSDAQAYVTINGLLDYLDADQKRVIRTHIDAAASGHTHTINVTTAHVYNAILAMNNTQDMISLDRLFTGLRNLNTSFKRTVVSEIRGTIEALGRDITTRHEEGANRRIMGNIYIVTDATGVVAIGSGSYTLQAGQKAVGIDFAGGVT